MSGLALPHEGVLSSPNSSYANYASDVNNDGSSNYANVYNTNGGVRPDLPRRRMNESGNSRSWDSIGPASLNRQRNMSPASNRDGCELSGPFPCNAPCCFAWRDESQGPF